MAGGRRPNWFEDPRVSLTPGQRYTVVIVLVLTVLMLRIGLPRGGAVSGFPPSSGPGPAPGASVSSAPGVPNTSSAPAAAPVIDVTPSLPAVAGPTAVPPPPSTEADLATASPAPSPAADPPPASPPTTTTTTPSCTMPTLPAVGGVLCEVP